MSHSLQKIRLKHHYRIGDPLVIEGSYDLVGYIVKKLDDGKHGMPPLYLIRGVRDNKIN